MGVFAGEKLFHEREASERVKRDLFPLQKIASSDVILALAISVPVACVSHELSQYA